MHVRLNIPLLGLVFRFIRLSASFNFFLFKMQDIQNFFCPNCLHKKHQCFACGKLGNSDKTSDPEV